MASIRLKVKEVARLRGMSQYRLAKVSQVDERTLRRIYRHPIGIVVSTDTLARLADALQVDVSELIESDPPGPRPSLESPPSADS